jgi:phospholipase C
MLIYTDRSLCSNPSMSMTRRNFLTAGAGLLGAATLGPGLIDRGSSQTGGAPAGAALSAAALSGGALGAAAAALPNPATSGLDHIVVLCMENRSFDHMLGWLPGANGRQAGLSYPDTSGVMHPTYHLITYQGCGHADPDHSYSGARVEYNNGACDGWLRANDAFSIGYYLPSDLPFLGHVAPAYTVCDNYFAATLGPTIPNRIYLHTGQTDRIDNSLSVSSLPTIWDSLAAAGVSHTYYYNDLPLLSLWGLTYTGISHNWDDFVRDAANGTLPAVSYIDPPLFFEAIDGTSHDDHPHGDIRNGEAFMNSVYHAITTSPVWNRTALVITFDEWGGFFDHVAPTTAPDTNPSVTGLRGFRVPTVVVSPFAPRGAVAHELYDHTSILNMIEWRHGLAPLTPRDAAANNLANVFDFANPNLTAPQWTVPTVTGWPCLLTGTQRLGN